MIALLAIALAFVAAAITTRYLYRSKSLGFLKMMDVPNVRSLHDTPKPRMGGLGLFLGVGLGVALWLALGTAPPRQLAWVGVGAAIVGGISFLDDKFSLRALHRFVTHFVAAGLLLYGDFRLAAAQVPGSTWHWPLAISVAFSLLYVVWMVNLYNFMDGMDGFSGGMAVFGFGTCAAIGWLTGHPGFAAVNLIVAAGAAGFLPFNFPPSRIFMGDFGASTLGFLAAAFTLWADRDGIFPLWIGVLVFSPFIVDATVTIIRRLLNREKIWQAHKTHFYQRLVQLGWGHRKTVLWEYALMAGCCASAVWAALGTVGQQQLVLAVWVVAYAGLMLAVTWLERRA